MTPRPSQPAVALLVTCRPRLPRRPAIGLVAVVMFGTLFGATGLLLAVPLTVVTMVLVTKLYLQPVLGEEVEAPGEAEP